MPVVSNFRGRGQSGQLKARKAAAAAAAAKQSQPARPRGFIPSSMCAAEFRILLPIEERGGAAGADRQNLYRSNELLTKQSKV